MEEDRKKKKKNNKKKNKQQAVKPKESDVLDVGATQNDEYVSTKGLEDSCEVSSGARPASNIADGHKDIPSQLANDREEENLTKAKELHWLDKEAVLEEKIKYLLKEKADMLQKEADQEDIIRLLNHEKDESNIQETHLKEKIAHLEKEKNDLCHKERSIDLRIEQLQSENHTLLQKEAALDMKIMQLKGEKDSWLQKEVSLEKKISHLVDEAADLNLKGLSLEEKIKQMEQERDSWILRENSAKESIQNSENIKLRAQVIELDHLSKTLIEEKQQLQERISSLELQINNLERTVRFPTPSKTSENGEATEVSRALVEKLMIENSELVEKMNELHAELEQRGKRQEDSFSVSALGLPLTLQSSDSSSLPPVVAIRDINKTAAVDTILELSKTIPSSSSNISLEDVMIEDQKTSEQHLNEKGAFEQANTSEIIEIDEIVQIPLHETEVTGTDLKEAENDEEKSDIPLIDAPLIGAPFRLISFMARYVSGADLVK